MHFFLCILRAHAWVSSNNGRANGKSSLSPLPPAEQKMVIDIDGAQSILLLFYFLSSSSESVWAPPSLRSRRRGSSVLHPTALSAAAFSRPFDQNMGIPDSEVFLIFLFIYLFLARRNSEASESPSPVAPAVVMFVKASR